MVVPSPREVARVDRAGLHVVDADNLMVVTRGLMFEQPVAYERLKQFLETRLLNVPPAHRPATERAPEHTVTAVAGI